MIYSMAKAAQLFCSPNSETHNSQTLAEMEKNGLLPKRESIAVNGRKSRAWSTNTIGEIGRKIGFLQAPQHPLVATVFVTKGGVFKTSICLNIARLAALHGIRTLVVGLDMQADMTLALGYDLGLNHDIPLSEAIARINQTRGLPDLIEGRLRVTDLIQKTDLPNLDLIPETPELVALEQELATMRLREYWLKREVCEPLKGRYDLIIFDASPNWNLLITNALAASDILISPIECKINNFRNFKMFSNFISEFCRDLNLSLKTIFVPTRHQQNRKLSHEIFQWYRKNLTNCVSTAIPDLSAGEEATAMHLSVPEYAPNSPLANIMKAIVIEVWEMLGTIQEEKRSRTLLQQRQGAIHGTQSR